MIFYHMIFAEFNLLACQIYNIVFVLVLRLFKVYERFIHMNGVELDEEIFMIVLLKEYIQS